jgi:hypothetical protein
MSITQPLTNRAVAMLRAVAAGRAEMTTRFGPCLRIDGLLCCDQIAARNLADAGLVRPAVPHSAGAWVPAELTSKGRDAVLPQPLAAA